MQLMHVRKPLVAVRCIKSSSTILSTSRHRDIFDRHDSRNLTGYSRLFSTTHPRFVPAESFLATLRNDINVYKTVSKDIIHQRYSDLYTFYEQFSRMDEVRDAHDKVIDIQDELIKTQKRRSDLMTELAEIRSQKKVIDGEMSKCSQTDTRYLDLVRRSIEAKQLENEKMDAYQVEDIKEKNMFSHYISCINTSQKKESIHSNTLKYWSIVGSLITAFVSTIAVAIGYHIRKNSHNTLTESMKQEFAAMKVALKQKETESWSGFFWRKSVDSYRYFVPRSSSSNQKSTESWTAFISRKSVDSYRYFVPRSSSQNNTNTESWTSFISRKSVDSYRYFVPKSK